MYEEFEKIKPKIKFVSLYVGDSTSSWPKVKTQILNAIPSKYRTLFQTRDELTKQHKPPSEFEKLVINYWKELTNVDLFIPEEKQFNSAIVRKPKSCYWTIAIARKKKIEKYALLKKLEEEKRNK